MAKTQYVVEKDGSVTFDGDVSEDVRKKAYAEAARQRAAATDVDPEEVEAIALESAEMTAERAHATDVEDKK